MSSKVQSSANKVVLSSSPFTDFVGVENAANDMDKYFVLGYFFRYVFITLLFPDPYGPDNAIFFTSLFFIAQWSARIYSSLFFVSDSGVKSLYPDSPSKPSPFFCPEIKFCIFFLKFRFIYSILYKPCIFKAYRLLNVQTLCIFPCFCPYEPKQGKFLFSADYLIQQSCGSTLRFPCSVSVNVHCGTDISVSEKFLHIFRCCTV